MIAVCSVYDENEDWEHSTLCTKKDNREEWVKVVKLKIKRIEQIKNDDVQQKMTVQEMLNYVKKDFNKTNNHCTSQQLIGNNDLFRGVIVKEWVMGNQGRIDFPQCNTVVVKICVQHYHEC